MTPPLMSLPTLANGLSGTGGKETGVWQSFGLTLSLKISKLRHGTNNQVITGPVNESSERLRSGDTTRVTIANCMLRRRT